MYNYAKIESLVIKKDIEDVVLDASYILSTIKFNNNVIKLMLNSEFLQIVKKIMTFLHRKRKLKTF